MRFNIVQLTLILALFISSCTSTKELRYFNDLPNTDVMSLPSMPQHDRQIQKGDRLQITMAGKRREMAMDMNNYGGVIANGTVAMGSAVAGGSENSGYIVDPDGFIDFPFLGKIKAEGLTVNAYKDTLTRRVAEYMQEPFINVRFFDFKFTVLGEVRNPGTFTIPQQRTTLLDALGAAGDLPRTAKRYDIQIYRDYNGERKIAKVDLRKKDLLTNSELFQVKHNDVIIVQPRDVALFGEETRAYTTLITVVLGVTTLLISVLK
jgi:polysaccharide export outer membrane protein